MTDKQNNPDPIAHADRLHAHAEALAARLLAASPTPPAEQQATSDPLDWPLPCDITAGGVTIGKGCPLRTVQTRLEVQAEANALLMRHLSREQAAPKAAPQQEAQEPGEINKLRAEALRLSEILLAISSEGSSPEPEELWADDYEPSDGDVYVHRAGLVLAMLATAPQPAPAPLSDEREAFESTWENLYGKKPVLWDTAFKEAKMDVPAHSAGKYFYRDAQAAWKAWQARAALAARGGQ